MKTFLVLFAVLLASTAASPELEDDIEVEPTLEQQRSITSDIHEAVLAFSRRIRDAGYDPIDIKRKDYGYALPVPTVFNASAFIDNFHSHGLSNIGLTRNRFAVITRRLVVDGQMHYAEFRLDHGSAQASALGLGLGASINGSVAIRTVRLETSVYVNVGIINGISIRGVSANFILGGIESNLNVRIPGLDISRPVNNFLSSSIPRFIHNHRYIINRFWEHYIYNYVNNRP